MSWEPRTERSYAAGPVAFTTSLESPPMNSSRASVSRIAALISLGILAVHQLRYMLAYGAHSGEELAHQGHGYLLHALPVIVAIALAVLAGGVVKALWSGHARPSAALSRSRRWVSYAAAILVVFATQELFEGVLFAGHPAGIAALLSSGGWLAVPLASLAAAAVAFADGLFSELEAIAAALSQVAVPNAPQNPAAPATSPLRRRPASPLAFGLARRPPPSPAH